MLWEQCFHTRKLSITTRRFKKRRQQSTINLEGALIMAGRDKQKDDSQDDDSRIFGGIHYSLNAGLGSSHGGNLRSAQDVFESQMYDIEIDARRKEERARIKRVQAETKRKEERRAAALQAERDEQARENIERLKNELRAQYLGSGLMTSAEFEKEWPKIKADHLRERVEASNRATMEAMRQTGDYSM
jgi:hypothetical protein